MGNVDYLGEILFQVAAFDAQFADGDHVEGFAESFGDALCREGFASSWRAVENGD